MGVRMSANFVTFRGDSRKRRKEFATELTQIMTESMAVAQMTMIERIDTSGTGYAMPAWRISVAGRRVTDEMRDAVKTEVDSSLNSIIGRLGWLDRQEDYFKYQDGGFRHYLSGKTIAGMYALRAGSDAGWIHFLTNAYAAQKRIFNA